MAKKRHSNSIQRAARGRKNGDVVARYDAAGSGRRMSGWQTPSSGPNTAITGLQKIRDRARDLIRNDWSAASAVRKLSTNTIGTGIVPRFKTKNADLKKKANTLWKKFVRYADADCVLDFYGLEALASRCLFSDGEVFVRQRPRRMNDGFTVPLQVQVLEADMCPLLDADIYPGMPIGNKIRQGVEYDQIGRRVAFWFWRAHPGDKSPDVVNASLLSRVPADQVCHVFDPSRPGTVRGVPLMASVIARARNIADFDDAVLERQKLANLFTLFVTKAMPSGANDPMTGLPAQGNPDEPVAALEPGISQELLPGEDVKFSDPPDAGANYADFMRMQHIGVAAGTGVPYELLTGDLKDVSDRTLRVIINEFRRLCEQYQWLLFVPQLCQRVSDWFFMFAALAGELSDAEIEELQEIQWSPQGWAYIHPVQDVQAKLLEVEGGLRSRSSVIAEKGDDPDVVDQERAEEKKRADDLGLTPPPPAPADPAQKDEQAAKDKQQQQEKKAANALLSRVMAYIDDDE